MDYHGIQEEKEKVMIWFRPLRNLVKIWRLLEIFVALALLLWSWTRFPFVLKIAGQFIVQLYQYLFNPHINFIIGNAIIIVVVFLSRQNTTETNTACTEDAFYQYVQITEFVSDGLIPPPPPFLAVETEEKVIETENAYIDKQIVVSENAVQEIQCDAVRKAIEEGKKQIERFKRTQSDKRRRDSRSAPGRVLHRSETVVVYSDDKAITIFDAVDRLSNEEFRRTIDVIAKHRRLLWSQKIDENEQ